jgi:hypothetical protein
MLTLTILESDALGPSPAVFALRPVRNRANARGTGIEVPSLVHERVYRLDDSVGCLTGLAPGDSRPEKEVCDESPLTGTRRLVGGGRE